MLNNVKFKKMTIHERQEIAEAILNELHFRRYNEAISNGYNEKDAMTLADNWELYKDAQTLFKFYVDLINVSVSVCSCEMPAKVKGKNECWRCKKPLKEFLQTER